MVYYDHRHFFYPSIRLFSSHRPFKYRIASNRMPISILFLCPLCSSLINLQYGVIVKDPTITNVSFVGFILSSLYSCFYVFYTSKQGKQAVWNKLSIGAAITAASIAYAKYEDPAHLEFRFGILMTVFLFAMVAAPLLDLGDIIRNKSVGQMPFAMTLIGGVVGALWLLYSIILNNSLMIVSPFVVFCSIARIYMAIIRFRFRSRIW